MTTILHTLLQIRGGMVVIPQKRLITQKINLLDTKSHTIADDMKSHTLVMNIWTNQDMLLHFENRMKENTMIGVLVVEGTSPEEEIGEEDMTEGWP